MDTTRWGRVPGVQSITNGFDNNSQARRYQDVGLDGMNDEDERIFYAAYLETLRRTFGENSKVYREAWNDPAGDTYHFFRGSDYDALETPYNTRVARSKSITGPYLGIDGANVTEGADMYPVVTHPYKFANSEGWVGISHCAIFDDGNGNWYYASQGRLPESVDNAVMLGHVRSIRWTKDGWPLVMPERYGAVPQAAITEEELIGDWEHIDLSYVFWQQKESSTMTLTDDHKVSEGTWKDSSWSFDAENQILTVNGVDLYLQRETDWEAKPRTHTIVYASYTDNKTYWGKKSK